MMDDKAVMRSIREAKASGATTLDLSYGEIMTLPDEIGELACLQVLLLNSNQLEAVPESLCMLANLRELYLQDNRLRSIPGSIHQLTSLRELDLHRNRLTSIPESLGQLRNLRSLSLYANQLALLPASLGWLANLEELYLYGSALTSIPESLGNLTSLRILYCDDNELESIPESLGCLANLSVLCLDNNHLASIPNSLSHLKNLEVLRLSGNNLSSLPASLAELTNLKVLCLSRNGLDRLPPPLGELTALVDLDLSGNPLKSIPAEVRDRGRKPILDYLRQLRTQGVDRLHEAKLLIVGEAWAGKTSLSKKIQDPSYKLVNDERSTQGIDVAEWHFSAEGLADFRVNIWDFGGQEIYHATHQFFLTRRSLYVLVADTRKEDADFYYWLSVVDLLSNASPLLIVKNERGDRHLEMNENALRGEFRNITKVLTTNLATNRGLAEIIAEVKRQLHELPHIGVELPRGWVKVREALETDNRNYMSSDEYSDICERCGFEQLADQRQLSGYLHDIGVCLHFQDDLLLRKTIILKPEWGTHAVYRLLDHDKIVASKGRFHVRDLEEIWHEPCYADMHAELLQLMVNFKLCYQIPDSEEYIVPELLERNQPKYYWSEADNLIVRYVYEFMPRGIITRFIVAMQQWIVKQEWVWREGVILEKGATRAEVIEHYGKREIRIRLLGKRRRDFLVKIMSELDRINDTYKRLKCQRLIPCNCEVCNGSQEPHFYPYDTLMEFLDANQTGIQCQKKPYRMVNVQSLVEGMPSPGGRTSAVAPSRRFAVALTFPGEKREFVAKVARQLADEFGRDRVFYDRNFEAELARPNLDVYLQGIYRDDSDLIVVFLCADYERKEWCGREWRAVRDLIGGRQVSDIMLVRLEEAQIPGLFSLDGYIDASDRTPEQIARKIVERYHFGERQRTS